MPLAMKKMPEDLAMAAAEADDTLGSELSMAMPKPERPYGPKVATALMQAVSKIASTMGADVAPEAYSGPVAELGEDAARFLAMIEAAAGDYGQPFPIPLSGLKGDAELTTLTAFLTELAKDKEFEAFLSQGIEEEEEVEDEASEPEGDMDSMFRKRM
jgi:hypothetical protein